MAKDPFTGKFVKTHALSQSRIYSIWTNMLSRCSNPKAKGFHNYGGRGIIVEEPWASSFDAFFYDMGPTYRDDLTLERIENDGNYSKSNCRWATPREQGQNSRHNHRLFFSGENLTITEWAAHTGISDSTLCNRLRLGWSVAKTLSTPARKIVHAYKR